MSDDLEFLVGSTQGEGPSPEFVADLRAQIVAETEPAAARVGDPVVADVELRPEKETTMTKTGWLIGAVAAAVALVVGFALFANDDEGGLAVTDDVPTTTATPSTTTSTTTTMAPTTTSMPDPEPAPEVLAVIDQLLAARDYEALAATMTADGLASLRGQAGFLIEEEEANAEFSAFEIIGLQRTADQCVTAGASVVRCQVTQTSTISEAMGEAPTVRDATFNFEDGLVSVFPGLPGVGVDMGAYARGAGIEEQLDAACPRTGRFPPECAQFAIAQLDDWVAWEQANP